ncbi:MAG: acyltransferase, partial [Prevotella sp.]|nr:acyltransferase [Prevotella sp.]
MSRTESSALRGIAILGIILHNYCHFLGFAVKENEYKFDPSRPMQFLDKLFSLDSDLFIHFFSFLGHYGVPIFLFISGYGLVKKYEAHPKGGEPASAKEASPSGRFGGAFIKKHFLKLFRLMVIGYLVFIGIYLLRHSDGAQVYSWDRVLAQLTMTINFFYFDPDHIIKPGPYWYFGLMLQLYILYILVIHRWRSNWLLVALAIGSVALESYFVDSPDWLNYIRYNFIGALLPFCMGIWIAREEEPLSNSRPPSCSPSGAPILRFLTLHSSLFTLVISALFVLFGSLSFWTWLLVPVFVVTGAIATVKLISNSSLFTLHSSLSWFGSISAMLFVMHPIARELIISHYRRIDIYGGIFIYLLSSVALAMLL